LPLEQGSWCELIRRGEEGGEGGRSLPKDGEKVGKGVREGRRGSGLREGDRGDRELREGERPQEREGRWKAVG
jgi:hypothetical protein